MKRRVALFARSRSFVSSDLNHNTQSSSRLSEPTLGKLVPLRLHPSSLRNHNRNGCFCDVRVCYRAAKLCLSRQLCVDARLNNLKASVSHGLSAPSTLQHQWAKDKDC